VIILYISILLLVVAIIVLSIIIHFLLKKYKHIDKRDKEFIVFVIDMYCEYAQTLEIHSEEQHEKIVEQLGKIKKRYFEVD
jgi:competence protein ComGF